MSRVGRNNIINIKVSVSEDTVFAAKENKDEVRLESVYHCMLQRNVFSFKWFLRRKYCTILSY